jgi:hypothetical protein
MRRFEIETSDVLRRAQRNCARDGFHWQQPSGIFGLLYNFGRSRLLDDFGRLTYLAEAHWELFSEALGERDTQMTPRRSEAKELVREKAPRHLETSREQGSASLSSELSQDSGRSDRATTRHVG